MEKDKIESFTDSLPNVPMEITYDASEKTRNNFDSGGELNLKAQINQYLLHKKLHSRTDGNFITWENNNSNICWLDASMSLLVHNQTMRRVLKFNPDCQVSQIIKCYDDAMTTLNDFLSGKTVKERLNTARAKLLKVQESSLTYLQPFMKCKKGEPDSAFCCLLNLIKEDKLIQGFFDVTYAWVKQCEKCGMQRVASSTKPIITITHVNKFIPENHESPTACHCDKKDQKMKLVYKKLPACLIYHFENGAGDGDEPPLSFLIESREYQLTGVIVFEKGPPIQEAIVNHFMTFIRDPSANKWLECNDLNLDILTFTTKPPTFNLKDVYIYVYEVFDDLGTIDTKEDSFVNNSNQNIPIIDISDELDAVTDVCQNKTPEKTDVSESEENIENIKAFLSNPFIEDSNTSFSGDKVCAQVHVKSSRNVLKDCLDSKIKNPILSRDSSEFISHEKNIESEISLPFSDNEVKDKNVDLERITEVSVKESPKLSVKYLLNQASEKLFMNKLKLATPNTFSSEDKVHVNSSRNILKDCLDSKFKNSILRDNSEFISHEKGTENEILPPLNREENVGLKRIAEPKLSGKCPMNEASEEILKNISKDQNLHKWFDEFLGKFDNTDSHMTLSEVANFTNGNESSHMRKNLTNTGSTKTFLAEAEKKSGNETHKKFNSTVDNIKEFSQAESNTENKNEVFEETSNSSVNIGFNLNKTHVSEVNENVIDKKSVKKDKIKSKIPYMQDKSITDSVITELDLFSSEMQLMPADNCFVDRSEDSESLTSEIKNNAVTQKDCRDYYSNFMRSKVLNPTRKALKTYSKSDKSSLLEQSPSTRATLMEVTSPNKSKEMKSMNLESNDRCGKKKTNFLHDTPLKPNKEICVSPHILNYPISDKRQTNLELHDINSETADEQLLLRMQKASLKNQKSDSLSYMSCGTGTSKSKAFPYSFKHGLTCESDDDKSKVKFNPKIRRLDKTDEKMKNKESLTPINYKISESPVQYFTAETRITNSKNVADMDLSIPSFRVRNHVDEVSKSSDKDNKISDSKQRNECSSELKHIRHSPIQYTDCIPKKEKVLDIAVPSCSYNVAKEELIELPKMKKFPMDYNGFFTENIKGSESNNHFRSSFPPNPFSTHEDMSCEHPNFSCKKNISQIEAVDTIVDNVFFTYLNVFKDFFKIGDKKEED